ncbi:SEL1-like repeat protein [Thiomicrorhabdus sp. 6S2-11]|uniref:SEL1-like repeat protein n=1 Tax=Thiomicrorhabdus marina TaxID=2818442 RepID=A0ABS3Q458_9GAMM|nr:DUF2971 domain-containing protein [Thiomicrorhabdus marina]MBO1927120.1 SEL1-like repeat protein [Thiomicrorhabdus marina]
MTNEEYLELVKLKAKQNDPAALHLLAMMYKDGKSNKQGDPFEQNLSKFLECEKKAAELGNIDALMTLAKTYKDGLEPDIQTDNDLYIHYLSGAAKKENIEALNLLANEYLNGKVIEKNLNKFYELTQTAASTGDLTSLFNYAIAQRDGLGTEKNLNAYTSILRELAEQDYADAIYNLSLCYQSGDGVPQSDESFVSWTIKGANLNHPEAVLNLGLIHKKGLLTPVDINSYKYWLNKAIDLNSGRAHFQLGMEYYSNGIFPQNNERFVRLLEAAAKLGFVDASVNLAFYFKDSGNSEEALKWTRFGAENNIPQSQHNLAIMHKEGYHETVNLSNYIYWLEKAAESNYAPSLANLAHAYLSGIGVNVDYDKHIELLEKAAEIGDPNSIHFLAEYYYFGSIAQEKRAFPEDLDKAEELFRIVEKFKANGLRGFIYANSIEASKNSSVMTKESLTIIIYNLLELHKKIIEIKENKHKVNASEFGEISHFTSYSALQSMLQNNSTNVLRLYNAAYMNDPLEGRTLTRETSLLEWIFDRENKHELHSYDFGKQKYSIYLASFTLEKADRLDLWRAYGNDGDGFSISVPSSIFINNNNSHLIQSSYSSDNTVQNNDEDGLNFNLYKVIYDNRSTQETIDLISPYIKNIKAILESIEDKPRRMIKNTLKVVLSDLLYLYKNEEYSSEKEARIITSQKMSSNLLKIDEYRTPGRLFMTTKPFLFSWPKSKITIGPKVKDKEHYFLKLQYDLTNLGFDNTTEILFSSIEYRD